MASYYTTIDKLDERVNQIDDLLSENLMSIATLSNGIDLEQMYENAVNNLRGLLGYLGYNITDETDLESVMKELNNKIKEFQSTTAKFNGELLRQNIINPLKDVVSDFEAKEIDKFKKLLKGNINNILPEIDTILDQLTDKIGQSLGLDINNYTDDEVDLVAKAIVDSIKNITFDFNSGAASVYGYSSLLDQEIGPAFERKLIKAIGDRTNKMAWLDVVRAQVGPAAISRLLIMAQQQGIAIDGLLPESTKKLIDMNITSNIHDNTMSLYFNIYEDIPELNNIKTEKKARDYFEKLKTKNPTQYNILVEELIQNALKFTNQYFTVAHLPQNRQAELTQRFEQAIRDIVTNYPASLFMGSNIQGIIGILGEIQGLYYVYSIMGDNYPTVPPDILVQWIGGDTTAGSGAKTGADIFIAIAEKAGYGIQVKNSMDELSSTSFSDFTLKDTDENAFFSQLVEFGIDPNIVSAIEDVFMMRGFNIGYHYNGLQPVAGEPYGPRAGEYHTDYARILELVERAQRFMALAAAMIMRIQYLEGINYKESNTLWLIGGTAAISAAQILRDLIDQINNVENSNTFKTTATTYVDKTSFTIVEYLSNNIKTTKGLKTILRTSYNFHKTGSKI